MTGVEEIVAGVGCSSQTDDQMDGNEFTDVKVELTLACCGGNNEGKSVSEVKGQIRPIQI